MKRVVVVWYCTGNSVINYSANTTTTAAAARLRNCRMKNAYIFKWKVYEGCRGRPKKVCRRIPGSVAVHGRCCTEEVI